MLSPAARQYHALYESQEKPLLFTAPWWLDMTSSQGKWDAAILKQAGTDAISAVAFHQTRIRGLSAIITPPLTQWVALLHSSQSGFELPADWLGSFPSSSILDLTIKNLPSQNELRGKSSVATRYSYVLPFESNFEKMTEGYNEGLRRNIKQAESKFSVQTSDDIKTFIAMCHSTYAQRKMKSPWWVDDLLPSVVSVLLQKNAGSLSFIFRDETPVGSMLTAWDSTMSYYIAGGRIASEDSVSAHALLMHAAITDAHHHGRSFDFEGSMVPGIANFFQSFGAKPIPYYQVKHYRGFGKWWALFH